MPYRVLFVAIAALALMAAPGRPAADRPSVLFATGPVHNGYVVRPLVAMGIDVDVCRREELPQRLATGQYNVVVVSNLGDGERAAAEQFLQRGGGVFACNPEDFSGKEWAAQNEWLAKLGARPRWEVLGDADVANTVTDEMRCRLSYSDRFAMQFSEGVRGVLTLTWHGTTGCEPPMSFDFGSEWTVTVRGAASLKGVPEARNDEVRQPWIPREPVAGSPALMAVRQVGAGRLAAVAFRSHWIFTPPANCPTTEAMLTAGAGGKPSDWLRVFANTFRWLAEPSRRAGLGGAGTPDAVLDPPVKAWEIPPLYDWSKTPPMQDQRQTQGLIGARTALSSGSGTVADYARAAKAAGLSFIVFLEDSLKMDQAKWDRLVEECEAEASDDFAAVPGLTYEDAQGDHLYAFADQVRFPKPSMLLPDGRLATTQKIRTRAYFDYVNELMLQRAITGFWNHRANFLRVADYKLYNSFPIFSFQEGKPVDDALHEFLYLQGIGGCQAALAFELMSSPAQVARRAAEGWRAVANRPPKDLASKWHEGAWSFSGSGSQYITNGPSILVWESPNRLIGANGLWWRPDLWEYRLRLRVASDAGLKSVAIHDGDREIFRRWLPGGARTFEQELVLANCRQRGWTLIVEDQRGRRAISMSFWNRNLNLEEFFCSDRCNFLGNARLRTRPGGQTWTPVSFQGNMGITPSKGRLDLQASPAVSLTPNSPTLPIDGKPMGFPTAVLRLGVRVPDEITLFAYPRTYMVGPEIAVGQADIALGYDPAEKDAPASPLGHAYEQPQEGSGNSWGSWHRLVPSRKTAGWARTYATNWLTEGFRLGWHEERLTVKEPIPVDPEKGLTVLSASGDWVLHGADGGAATGDRARLAGAAPAGRFQRGTFFTLSDLGGSVILLPMDGPLEYRYRPGPKGSVELVYQPGKPVLEKGDEIQFRVAFAGARGGLTTEEIVAYAQAFGAAEPGRAAYAAKLSRGKQIDNYLLWHLDGDGKGIEARLPKTPLPGFLTACVENLNDNWSVWLQDRARPAPNVRALPIRDGRAFAELDLVEADSDLFIGHPVVADDPRVKLLVSWEQPGVWFVEAHNPTDAPMAAHLSTAPGWGLFRFDEKVTLPPGTSRVWHLREEPHAVSP